MIHLRLRACLLLLLVLPAGPDAHGQDQSKPLQVPAPEGEAQPRRWVPYSIATKSTLIKSLPKPMFREAAAQLGVRFRHTTDPAFKPVRARLEIPLDVAGGGVSAGDFNQDGFPDLFFAGFGGGRLFRNEQGKRFVDATDEAGLGLMGESRAAYFIDHDNDGDADLFVSFVGQGIRLFENDGAGKFTSITTATGLDVHQDITHELVFLDIDNDGLLDIYAASFARWDRGDEPVVGKQNFNGAPNRLYHHSREGGKHQYLDIGSAAGVDDRGWTHSVGAWDYDKDGKPDLFSFNDFGRSHIYHNLGDLKFQEVSIELGVQENYNAMGFALMDLNHDGEFEYYVPEISNPMFADGKRIRYRHVAGEQFVDPRVLNRLRQSVNNRLFGIGPDGLLRNLHGKVFEAAETGWAWDCSPLDYENDGDLDFLILNGTESNPPRLPEEKRPMHLEQADFIRNYSNDLNMFFMSEGGFLYNLSGVCELSYRGNSRSSAFLDFDMDGDLDVAINDYEENARLFINEQRSGNAWIRLELRGRKSNREAMGARIRVLDSSGRTQSAIKVSGSGFLSQDAGPMHFGLGKDGVAVRVSIQWPSGTEQSLENLASHRTHTISEP